MFSIRRSSRPRLALEAHAASVAGVATAVVLAIVVAPRAASAQECTDFQNQHPDWILCDDFESGAIDSTIWNDVSGTNTVVSTPVHEGSHALDMMHPAGSTGGYMNSIWYPTGYTSLYDHGFQHLYLRWWVNFDTGFNSSTKIAGFTVKASNMSSFWDGHVGAGFRPDGIQNGGGTRIVTHDDGAGLPGTLRFYTYHREMMVDRWTDGGGALNCGYYGDSVPPPSGWVFSDVTDPDLDYYCAGPGTAAWNEYANLLSGYDPGTYSATVDAPAGSWTCIELEMRINDAGASDGLQRMWVADALVGEWTGLRFSESSSQMLIHALQLTASSGSHPAEQHSYYDNVVVSTSRIGCNGSPPDGPDAGAGGGTAGTGGTGTGSGTGAGEEGGSSSVTPPSSSPGDDSGGCGCRIGSAPRPQPWSWLLLVIGVALPSSRRRLA